MVYKGKNHSIKLRKYHFCTTTAYYHLCFSFYSIVSLEKIFRNGTRLGMDKIHTPPRCSRYTCDDFSGWKTPFASFTIVLPDPPAMLNF